MAHVYSGISDLALDVGAKLFDSMVPLNEWRDERHVGSMLWGVPFPPELVPKRVAVDRVLERWMGLIRPHWLGEIVDSRFRQAVEEIEPGVHWFHPIALQGPDGQWYEGEYAFPNICTSVDAIDPTNPKIRKRHVMNDPVKYPDSFHYEAIGGNHDAVILHADPVRGRAMWFDSKYGRPFFSDALVDRLSALGIKGLRLSKRLPEV